MPLAAFVSTSSKMSAPRREWIQLYAFKDVSSTPVKSLFPRRFWRLFRVEHEFGSALTLEMSPFRFRSVPAGADPCPDASFCSLWMVRTHEDALIRYPPAPVTPRRLTLSSGAATGGDRPAARHVTTVHRDRTTVLRNETTIYETTFFMRHI